MKKTAILVLILSLALMGAGLLRQEHDTVLSKGINICLECIGIG